MNVCCNTLFAGIFLVPHFDENVCVCVFFWFVAAAIAVSAVVDVRNVMVSMMRRIMESN